MLSEFRPIPHLLIAPLLEDPLPQEEVFFGEGPDPFPFIDESQDPQEKQLALLCLATREIISKYLNSSRRAPAKLLGMSCLTAAGLAHLCGLISSCVSYQLKQLPELQAGIYLIYHQAQDLFPADAISRHTFLVANIEDRYFILDLSFRQFFHPGLKLHKEEAEVCDTLLKYGFIELTEHTLSVYRNLLRRASLLPIGPLEPVSLENLKRATAENDYEDLEIVEFLSFQRNELIRAYSQPILDRPPDALHDQEIPRKMRRALSDIPPG